MGNDCWVIGYQWVGAVGVNEHQVRGPATRSLGAPVGGDGAAGAPVGYQWVGAVGTVGCSVGAPVGGCCGGCGCK